MSREWWNSVARETFAPDFVRKADEFIANAPDVNCIEALGSWEQ